MQGAGSSSQGEPSGKVQQALAWGDGPTCLAMVTANAGHILGRSSEEEEETRAEAGLTHPLGTVSGTHDTSRVPWKYFNFC